MFLLKIVHAKFDFTDFRFNVRYLLTTKKFIRALLITLMVFRGKANFRNMSRFSSLCEKTFSRWYRVSFDFKAFNNQLIFSELPKEDEWIAAIDASFVKKSGKCTSGLGNFWSGGSGSAEKGLEVSLLSIVHLKSNTAYGLDAKQTIDQEGKSRTDLYAEQTVGMAKALKDKGIRYISTDSFYTKIKYVNPVAEAGLHIVGKLRIDARLKWLYEGEYSGKGRPKKFDGKVDIEADLCRFEYVGEIDEGKTHMYTTVAYSVSLKRDIKVVMLIFKKGDKEGRALLYSTDTNLAAMTLLTYYKARFQIEFVFRDAKQYTGLMDCQSCNEEAINFQLNASFTALNLMKIEDRKTKGTQGETVISIASCGRFQHTCRLKFTFMPPDLLPYHF